MNITPEQKMAFYDKAIELLDKLPDGHPAKQPSFDQVQKPTTFLEQQAKLKETDQGK